VLCWPAAGSVFRGGGAELRSECAGRGVRAALGGAALPSAAPLSAAASVTGGGQDGVPGEVR